MSLLYISTDLNVKSSGGLVASKELEAMKSIDEEVVSLDFTDIHPTSNNLPDIPFLIDYLTVDKLSRMDNLSNIKLAHFYGGCYNITIKYLKSKNIKTSFSCMFHERKISIEEHEKYFGTYPYQHVKDDNLWRMYVSSSLKHADIIITPGKAPKENILKESPNSRVEIIPHGTDIPPESKISPIPEQFNTGYMGAVGPDKGLYYLIKAISQLNYKDSTMVFAGSQTQYLPQFINTYVKTGNYHIMGYVNNISDFYKNISLYIQPSTTEGFGIETVEAMSYARPVIVSDGAGSADCIENGKEGFVVPRMNPQAIADKIQYFKDNPSEIYRMGKNARNKSYQYSWDKIKQKYVNIWNHLLNE